MASYNMNFNNNRPNRNDIYDLVISSYSILSGASTGLTIAGVIDMINDGATITKIKFTLLSLGVAIYCAQRAYQEFMDKINNNNQKQR